MTQTLQLDVDELFANLLDWGPPASSHQQAAASPSSAAATAAADSKKLCGNVASDQPDLIGLDVWPAAVALCTYLAARPHLASGAAVCELGAGALKTALINIGGSSPPPTLPQYVFIHPLLQAWGCRVCCAPSWAPPRCC